MTIPPPGGLGVEPRYVPTGTTGDWTSPLWGRPDTQAAAWPAASEEPFVPVPPLPPLPPPRGRSRGLLVTALVALVMVALLGAVLVSGALTGRSSDRAAADPRPGVSTPAAPVPTPSPSAPALAPPSQGPGQQGQGMTARQRAAVAAVSPGLVDIDTTIGYGSGKGAGTGVVLTSDGIVLTNHHVVAGATRISVRDVGNGKTYGATVLGYDTSHDIAVLRLTGASGLVTAPLGESSTVAVGDAVVAVGNAGGVGGTPSAVAGKVTALDQAITVQDPVDGSSRRLTGLIQSDAAVEPGDSGGALIDADGRVVGIVTAGSFSSVQQPTATQGFAVPMATARTVADQILAGRSSGTVHIGGSAFLGLQVASVGRSVAVDGGVLVAGVVPGTGAERAGITTGDVITAVDGDSVTTADELHTLLDAHHPGDKVTVSWTDPTGATHSAKVTLADGPVG